MHILIEHLIFLEPSTVVRFLLYLSMNFFFIIFKINIKKIRNGNYPFMSMCFNVIVI